MIARDRFPEVLAAAKIGEGWALEELYRTYHSAVLRYLTARLGDEAEDLAADVWIEITSALKRFKGDEGRFRGLIFTIARRRVIDQRRKHKARRTHPVELGELADIKSGSDPEQEVVGSISVEEALASVRRISDEQADVLMLRVVGGLSVKQTARALGKRPGAVRALQHRALKNLAKQISRPPVTEQDPDTT